MRLVFAMFWGAFAASALTELGRNLLTAGPLWRDVAGLFVVAWCGGNSYLWCKDVIGKKKHAS